MLNSIEKVTGTFLLLVFLSVIMISALPLYTGTPEFTGDDYYYVANNPLVTSSGQSALVEIWRRPMKSEYFPVTITSYALEYRLWGLNVKLFHLTNLLLFAGIGITTYFLALQMSAPDMLDEKDNKRRAIFSAVATLLLLSHPLNVESVASISNRKELLYALFALLSLRCYLVKSRGPVTFFGALLFMILAQLSKGSAVILPAIFVVCEALRYTGGKITKKNVLFPVSYAVVALTIFIIQFRVALKAGVIEKSGELELLARIGGIIRSVNVMLVKFLYPLNLVYDYDIPWPTPFPSPSECLLPLALIALLIWLAVSGKRSWFFMTCMVCLALLPYANVIPLRHNIQGQMVFYDHYLLLAIMLSAPLVTRMLMAAPEQWQFRSVGAMLLSMVAVSSYNNQLYSFWKTRETLYQRIIAVAPKLPKGYLFLGKSYNSQGRHAEAVTVLTRIFSLNNWLPTFAEVYRELGNAYAFSGRYAEAEVAYKSFLQYQQKDRATLQNLSATLIEQQKLAEAREVILEWLQEYPDDADAKYNLQICEQQLRNR